MAQKNVTIIIDDMTGKELADGAGETVSFSLDGVRYELDVDTKSAGRLRSVLAPYIKAGRRLHGTRGVRARRVKTGERPGRRQGLGCVERSRGQRTGPRPRPCRRPVRGRRQLAIRPQAVD